MMKTTTNTHRAEEAEQNRPVGRPRRSALSRQEQLRTAKQAQRRRQFEQGLVKVEFALPAETAQKLKVLGTQAGLRDAIEAFVEQGVVDMQQFPALRELAWNRADRFVRAVDALALYERNWRFIDQANLRPEEGALIKKLVTRFGNGVLNV